MMTTLQGKLAIAIANLPSKAKVGDYVRSHHSAKLPYYLTHRDDRGNWIGSPSGHRGEITMNLGLEGVDFTIINEEKPD